MWVDKEGTLDARGVRVEKVQGLAAKMATESGFEMCFAIGSQHRQTLVVPTKPRLESGTAFPLWRIKCVRVCVDVSSRDDAAWCAALQAKLIGLHPRKGKFKLWYGMAWHGMVWYGMVWYGMVWYGMVWYGMVWYGMVWCGCAAMIPFATTVNEPLRMLLKWITLCETMGSRTPTTCC